LRAQSFEESHRVGGGLSLAQQKTQERAFGDRACCQLRFGCFEPAERDLMVDVIDNGQRYENVAIGQERAHASSSNERTSSAVTGRPTET
jgi:hypothetical protein